MAVLDIETLLKPISDDAPCGRDMEYDAPFLSLQELARGKPEQVIGDKVRPAQDPPWPKVREAAEELFGSTKDLRVAGTLYLSLLKTSGIAGCESGLGILRALLERYWDNVFPMLDADDNNDPTFRVNTLVAALVSDDALATLRLAPLVESRQFGRHSLRAHRFATGTLNVEVPEGTDLAQELAKIEGAFGDVAIEALTATAAVISAASDHLNAIQHVLLDKADGIPDDLKSLSNDLREMKGLFEAQLARRGVGDATADDAGAEEIGGSDAGSTQGSQPISGTIRNRSDVMTTIDKICDYYAKAEPSSPVPLLLQRAKRLVDKDFMEILRDLTTSGASEAEVVVGLEKRD
ncbi:type VI secretion system protein TssA [Povalibacter sp.]|uniref:type VI secretion system protein TssA n=1 Tax=Povalibacter sp. TaxID=1962978 RepID=UPI002F3F158F